jgi:adenine-specific DNA methylase
LNLTVSTYKAEDNSLIRTDVFNGLLIGDTVSLHGNTTFYDDLEGCPMVLELIWVDNEDKKSKTILNQVTNKNSRTDQCTIIGH